MKWGPKSKRAVVITLVILAAVGVYWGGMELQERNPLLNFDVVEPGRLLRSGQPYPGDLDRIQAEYGLGAIICLRGFEVRETRDWAVAHNVELISMSMLADVPPTEDQVGLFFDVVSGHTVDIPHYRDTLYQWKGFGRKRPVRFKLPVLVHCIGGADRTGVMVAMYHMAYQGWDLKRAQRDMMLHWHIPPSHPAMFDYLERMAPLIKPGFGSRTDLQNLTPPPKRPRTNQPPSQPDPPDAQATPPAPPPSPEGAADEATLVPPAGG